MLSKLEARQLKIIGGETNITPRAQARHLRHRRLAHHRRVLQFLSAWWHGQFA